MSQEGTKLKTIVISVLPSIFFLIALIFLAYSPLTISKLLTFQNDIFITFVGELKQDTLPTSFSKTLGFVWSDLVSTIVVFLIPICIGLLINLTFFEKVDSRISLISNFVLVIFVYVLTRFSLVPTLIAVGLFLGDLWIQKTFERKKNNFSTGYSFVKSRLRLVNLFFALGVLLVLLSTVQLYEEQIQQSNLEMLKLLSPQAEDVKELQKTQTHEFISGIKSSLNAQYKQMPDQVKNQCDQMYTGLVQGLDEYEKQATEEIEKQELGLSEEEISQLMPFFDVMVKSSPLFTALGVYIILGVLNPIMSIMSGIVYSLFQFLISKLSRTE